MHRQVGDNGKMVVTSIGGRKGQILIIRNLIVKNGQEKHHKIMVVFLVFSVSSFSNSLSFSPCFSLFPAVSSHFGTPKQPTKFGYNCKNPVERMTESSGDGTPKIADDRQLSCPRCSTDAYVGAPTWTAAIFLVARTLLDSKCSKGPSSSDRRIFIQCRYWEEL